jgi:predicted O-methyltransferase YrrM
MANLPISLVAIVRNAGGRVRKLIENHRDVVSEVIIIDQYSTDGTYEEAEELADLVFQKRCKGTSDPDRNWAFSLASQPYVLYLDDDEGLTDETKKLLPEILKTGGDAFWLKRNNYVDGVSIEEILGDDPQCRLFKRGSVKFPNEIHRYPEPANGLKVHFLDCAIRHDRGLEQLKRSNKAREAVASGQAKKLQDDFVSQVETLLKEKDGFTENWYPTYKLDALKQAAESIKGAPGIIVEIGCWEGKSTCTLANAVYPETVHAVDTWQGNIAEGADHASVVKAKERDVHKAFLANIAKRTKGNVTDRKQDCMEYLKSLKCAVKFCHIDAAHDYASVKQTIQLLKPLLVKGAILCGDDFMSANANRKDLDGGVERAVREECPGFDSNADFWYWVNK